MGIRLDQVHAEVFSKIATDIATNQQEIYSFLERKLEEIDIIYGLPEITQVERDVEVNKRNLEKSGFIDINRNFVPFGSADQGDTGVWVSNLNTNESPFEPRTIDGQKRGISIAGHILNYTVGDIGQNIEQMMKLPIAPNLPVFFPEDNDMVMAFSPSKVITHQKIVTDSAVEVSINNRITDESKIDISIVAVGDELEYYYMDDTSDVYYLNDDGRTYLQSSPSELLVEPYHRFMDSFGQTFTFEKIYDDDAVVKYIDPETNGLFEIKTPLAFWDDISVATNVVRTPLRHNDAKVFLETMTISAIREIDGVEQVVDVTQPMLVTIDVTDISLNGMETQVLTKTLTSMTGFERKTKTLVDGGDDYDYISDGDIEMYIEPSAIYFYHPFRKYATDDNGDNIILTAQDIADDTTLMYWEPEEGGDTYQLVYDEAYRTYLPIDVDYPSSGTVQITDNISGGNTARSIHSVSVETVIYYKVETVMFQDTNEVTVLDVVGLPTNVGNTNDIPNVYRPVTINTEGTLEATMVDALVGTVGLSSGKEFYYHPTVGTKYYRKRDGSITYINSDGVVYTPAQDVQEIFEGFLYNVDTLSTTQYMFYTADGAIFFIDSENLRTYVEDEIRQRIQLTDVNGYRVFEKNDGTRIYVVSSDKMVTISNGVETTVGVSYSDMSPLFETSDVEESVLNRTIPVPFNFVQGTVNLTRNGVRLDKYTDYNGQALLRLTKDLEFNEDTNEGDTLYIKRFGKKDIILRLEKKGTATDDTNGDWANDTGVIITPEPLSGNSFKWTEGEELQSGEELDYNDVVKMEDGSFYQYIGTALSYDDLGADKSIAVITNGIFWQEVTADVVEYESKGQSYKIVNADEGDIIRFTVVRRVWEQHPDTGEMTVVEKAPYTIEKVALQDGENLFLLNDANFFLDGNASVESHILMIDNIKYFGTFENNRVNNLLLIVAGIQTVTKNDNAAMVYGDDYFLSDFVLHLNNADVDDEMVLTRLQAPQAELKIDFEILSEQEKVTVPFEIIKNKYDIVLPRVIDGHEYTWIMGTAVPEGKVLRSGDVVFDKDNLAFYKFIGDTQGTTTVVDGVSVFTPTYRETLLRQPEEIQKELLRQLHGIARNDTPGQYWDEFNALWTATALSLSEDDGLTLTYFVDGVNGIALLNTIEDAGTLATNDAPKVTDYLKLAKINMIREAEHKLNIGILDGFEYTDLFDSSVKASIISIVTANLEQSVVSLVRYNDDNTPVLDEDGEIVYDFEYTRNFTVSTRYNETLKITQFIERSITGVETVVTDKWEDITADEVGYYRFGKTFTVLDTKSNDNIVVRLLDTGAEEFTSKRVVSEGGEKVFAIDFNIEEDDGSEIGFEVIHEESSWAEGVDYIQEGQTITLTMTDTIGQNVIIRRNDAFSLADIVVLERKDIVFVEMWHEAVSDTDFIFPLGNVQYQGNSSDTVPTRLFDHTFYDTVDGEETEIKDGHVSYCQMYNKGSIVYNYYDGTSFDVVSDKERKYIDSTFVDDTTIGKGWKVSTLSDEERTTIFKNADHNLYYDGDTLVQVRYRTRVSHLNLFDNYFKGTSEYMSSGLRFQGSSPTTSRIITREVGEVSSTNGDSTNVDTLTAGKPITETIQQFDGGALIIASNPRSLLYKEGKLYDDAFFTVEEPTHLSYNKYVHVAPIAIINRRNQGVYHPTFNENGTGFFINGIFVSEDKEDFADDISGFTLVDENAATLETSSVGRDRKAKFKVMLDWLFSTDYKAGGSMVSKTTYRPDGLLYDEINALDIIDLRIDANDQRKRIEDLEYDVAKVFNDLTDLSAHTDLKFEQTTNYINTTANLLYTHIARTELDIRDEMYVKDAELLAGLDLTNTNLADLSANVFTKDVTTNLLVDTMVGIVGDMDNDAFDTWRTAGAGQGLGLQKPNRSYILSMIGTYVENMEGPYTQVEFMKFLVTVLKSVTDKTMLRSEEMDRWIRRLSVKDLTIGANTDIYSRAETLELINEGLILASSSRILPPVGSDNANTWSWIGQRYNGWLGTKNLELKKDFLDNGKIPIATKIVNTNSLTRSYNDIKGVSWNKAFFAGPTMWGNVHNYHAIFSTWIFVETPFKVENVKMLGDDPHAIYINKELVSRNKHCCRETAYSYEFTFAGWYRIDAMYSERYGSHYVQLGWNPSDYQDKIRYMTTTNMDSAVEVTQMRLDNWSSKKKTLISTIKGDASGYFTKLEVKLVLIEGLNRIRDHILVNGANVTDLDLHEFHGNLETWVDNTNASDPGTFTALDYDVQSGLDDDGVEYDRSDAFRPIPDMSGKYNKEEVYEIVKTGLELVNGIDSISSPDIQKWIDRLNIKIDMPDIRYYTQTQTNTLLDDGINYLAGLDAVTSYEISAWLDDHVTKDNTPFTDVHGVDTSDTVDTNAYSKVDMKVLLSTKLKTVLGAQAAITQI